MEFEFRRGGGGGGEPIVIPLGLMLLALGFLALIFHKLRQSNIIACIIIGMVVGGTGLGDHVSKELTDAFIELGIILVLFMGGLEVDVPAFLSRWKLVVVNGVGQISITLAIFCVIGWATGLTTEAIDTIFFGLACTLSSTILVLGALKDRDEMESLHGQIILGLMVLQDVVAVISLAVLATFDPESKGGSLGVEIAIMFGKFAALLVILALLSKYVLTRLFRLFAVSGEMLFIGTVGYAFGVAGLCGLASFSAEIGGFFAGVSLSAVPYRLEIEHKVEPIKAFGVVLFFFMLGINLHITPEGLKDAAGLSFLVALLTVFVLPTIMWGLGWLTGLKARTAFMMGIIINQVSEFSLILAQLAYKFEVFDQKQFQVVTFATVITLLFSSIGHVQADAIFGRIGWILAPLDRNSTVSEDACEEFALQSHVVLLGFNETGLEIAEIYRQRGKDVLVVQLDPMLDKTFKKAYQTAHNPSHPERAAADSLAPGHGKDQVTVKGPGGVGLCVSAEVGLRPTTEVELAQPEREPVVAEGNGAGGVQLASDGVQLSGHGVQLSSVGVGGMNFGLGEATLDREASASTKRQAFGGRFKSPSKLLKGITARAATHRAAGTGWAWNMGESLHSTGGYEEGIGTNIYSVYADPEAPATWEHYKLREASLVVSCMVGGQEAEIQLSKDLAQHNVPFMAVTNSNAEARELYEAGCRYVIQQEYLAGRVMRSLITEEMAKGGELCFRSHQAEHVEELRKEQQDRVLSTIQRFL